MEKHIIILGGGFAGLAVAQTLEREMRDGEARVTLLSRDNFMLFTPMLPEVSSGSLETRHIVTPLRAELRKVNVVLAEVSRIDVAARQITVMNLLDERMTSYSYDELVIALGSVSSTFGLPGVGEYTLPLKTIEDGERLRNHVIAMLELAHAADDEARRRCLLSFVVVGGGYTGVETAGELTDLLAHVRRFYPRLETMDITVYLIEAGKALLPELPKKMGDYSAKNLTARGVQVRFGDGVAQVDQDGIVLQSGMRIDSNTIVWSAGVRPIPLVAELPLAKTRHGALITNPDMSLVDHPDLWSLGDCAAVPTAEAGSYYPATAQHAVRQGPLLARNILAKLRGTATKPFHFRSLGTMASLGARRGVAVIPGDIVVTGFPAWFMWRTYYLTRLPGLDRKVRVALDWFIGLFFPRDIAELRIFTNRGQRNAGRAAGMQDPKDDSM